MCLRLNVLPWNVSIWYIVTVEKFFFLSNSHIAFPTHSHSFSRRFGSLEFSWNQFCICCCCYCCCCCFFFVIFISYCFFVCRLCSKYFFFIPPIWYFTERVNRIFFFCDFLYVYIILSFGNGILVLVWVCATIEWIKKKMRVKKHAVQSLPQPTQMHN